MSVCIALVCNKARAIVCITDEKVNFGEFSADNIATKDELLSANCIAMYAGDDSEYAPAIIESTKAKLVGKKWTPEIAAECIRLSYEECLHREIEHKILGRYKLTTEQFLRSGRRTFTPPLFTSLCERIEKVNISLQFLVCGFEKHPTENLYEPHIYHVAENTSVTCKDGIGMWAIGAGNYIALSSLAFAADRRRLSKRSSLGEGVYSALESKFMAESHGSVGRNTNCSIITATFLRGIETKYVEVIRSKWKKHGAPKIPKGITKEIPDMLWGIGWKDEASDESKLDFLKRVAMREAEEVNGRSKSRKAKW